jgi:peptidoglycan-associated lipoprotein
MSAEPRSSISPWATHARDRRATYLERLGVRKNKISTVSYGSEHPKVPGHDESAWSQNRRDDFRIQ